MLCGRRAAADPKLHKRVFQAKSSASAAP